MSLLSTAVSGIVYFALGGVWFTPLFGRYWDRAVGFERPPRWRPPAVYYLTPFFACLVTAGAMGLLIDQAAPSSMAEALWLGLVVGLGFSVAVTTVNAVSPNMPRPGLYALVTGSYHLAGALLCAALHFWLNDLPV